MIDDEFMFCSWRTFLTEAYMYIHLYWYARKVLLFR